MQADNEKEENNQVICVQNLIHGAEDQQASDIDELAMLADTLGYKTVSKHVFKINRISPKFYLGSGNVELLKSMTEELGARAVLFDNELSPSQFHNLENELDVLVLTRTELILQIFSMRAKTKHAKLQVELAYLEFDQPRLKGKWTHFSRIKGGSGVGKGMGETQLEIDRRRSRERMIQIRKELKKLEKSKKTSRKGRQSTLRTALVGYTNAGKSTLFNALVKEHCYVEDKLFATLDTFTRKLYLGGDMERDVLISDTVGFIKKLPHGLVESFKSTLSEVNEADLLLHVIDAGRDDIELNIENVERVLAEVSADELPRILLFNKIDLIDEDKLEFLRRNYPKAVFISAVKKDNLDGLKATVKRLLLSPDDLPTNAVV